MIDTRLLRIAVALLAAGVVAGCSSGASSTGGQDSGAGGHKDAAHADTTAPSDSGHTTHATCTTASGCASGVCTDGSCAPPACAPSCTTGNACGEATDCSSQVCTGGKCAAPSCSPSCASNDPCGENADCASGNCTDGKCTAAGCAPSCPDAQHCGAAGDCASGVCTNGLCAAPSCAPACDDGNACGAAADCASGICTNDKCAVPSCSPTCVDGNGCGAGTDCASGVCTTGKCAPPSCSPTCGDGDACGAATDCGSGVCTSGKCAAPTCSPACVDGNPCGAGADCASAVCTAGTCAPPACSPTCPDANICGATTDCASGVCTNAVCAPPPCSPTCIDGNACGADGDCASAVCTDATCAAPACSPSCIDGHICGAAADCASGVCTNGKCAAPACAPGCLDGNGCGANTDCASDVCTAGKCAAPACSPKCADAARCALDTDCLSGYCSLLSFTCVDGASCKGLVTPAQIMTITTPSGSAPGGADAVGTPNANGAGQHAGLDTCGKGESTDPIGQQTHESCCKSLPITIAGKALRYDKYEVTAGRFRQFLESLNPPYDVRGWATAQFDASFNPTTPAGTTLAAELPIKQAGVTTNVVNLLPATAETFEPLNAVIQTGALDMSTAGSQGCYTAVGDFGAATYWWDATTLYDQASSPPRPFTQDYYDIKSMNCIPSWLGAAFCAWDGGRLPLQSEHAYVWDGGTGGTNTYPWGKTFLPSPYPGTGTLVYPNNVDLQGAAYQPAVAHTVDWYNSNLGSATQPIGGFYYYPSNPLGTPLDAPASIASGLDYTPLTAAPGRFFLDRTSLLSGSDGWQDLGANMIEMSEMTVFTGTNAFCDESGQLGTGESFNCNCPAAGCTNTACGANGVHCGITRATDFPTYAILGGSWEGHAVNETLSAGYPIYRQYGKLGLRCMRPAEP